MSCLHQPQASKIFKKRTENKTEFTSWHLQSLSQLCWKYQSTCTKDPGPMCLAVVKQPPFLLAQGLKCHPFPQLLLCPARAQTERWGKWMSGYCGHSELQVISVMTVKVVGQSGSNKSVSENSRVEKRVISKALWDRTSGREPVLGLHRSSRKLGQLLDIAVFGRKMKDPPRSSI